MKGNSLDGLGDVALSEAGSRDSGRVHDHVACFMRMYSLHCHAGGWRLEAGALELHFILTVRPTSVFV